jgi:glycine/D-amino acid oxidase-like deaminating enzyme
MLALTAETRASSLAAMADGVLDVLVIGGGITGAGVALDAAARGLRVGLVEREDIASGTSGRSSRLIHGGARYLRQAEFAWSGNRSGSGPSSSRWHRTWSDPSRSCSRSPGRASEARWRSASACTGSWLPAGPPGTGG